MSTIRETVKLYIYRDRHEGRIKYFTFQLEHCDWLILVGETTATVEYDDSMLLDPREVELKQAEDALKNARAELYVAEQRLREIEGDLNAYRSGWVQYDRENVRALQAERRVLLAEKCGCGGLCDPGHPCPMAYAAE